jgi:hypothetical protein
MNGNHASRSDQNHAATHPAPKGLGRLPQAPWKLRPVEGLENSNREFSTLPPGLGNPANCAGFPHFHCVDGGFYPL